MPIREATAGDWPRIRPFRHRIVVAAEDEDGSVVGSACLTADYGGPAARAAGAGFMADPDHSGRGITTHVLAEARTHGYRAMVFDAVVETNPAVAL